MIDGVQKPMGDIAYLLSPKDLAALEIVPELIEAGVTSFKIEGRMKSAEYVANVVSKYRAAIDAYFDGRDATPSKEAVRELQQSFSRGFTVGFLKGTNNKTLLDGTFPKSRGVYLGKVLEVRRDSVLVKLEAPVKRGDGIVFDAGDPTKDEEGGRVYDVRTHMSDRIEGEAAEGTMIELVAGRNDVDLLKVQVGNKIWKTSDPALDRRLRATFETDKPYRTGPLHVKVSGKVGEPLKTWWTDVQLGNSVYIESDRMLETALKRPLTVELLEDQFGRTGGTLYHLESIAFELQGDVIVPMSVLNQMRRDAIEQLEPLREKPPVYKMKPVEVYNDVVNDKADWRQVGAASMGAPEMTVLCRTLEQVEAAVQTDIEWVYADFEFIKQFPAAVDAARAAGKKIALTTPRIHMPGENGYFNNILKLEPDAVLVRNTGAAYFFLKYRAENPGAFQPKLFGDFSLNVANHKSVQLFLEAGLDLVTPSYDLNIQQMVHLLQHSATEQMEIVIHQHIPMFHTEHCVYCTFLSEGTDYTNCGRPCEDHRVSLQDRIGMSHPVRVDEGCRNTVYNALEQSGAEYVKEFLELGVNRYRVEFLEESGEKVTEVLNLYRDALDGRISGTQVWKTLKATNQLGVTRGQLIKENFTEKVIRK
jgi:putative protease